MTGSWSTSRPTCSVTTARTTSPQCGIVVERHRVEIGRLGRSRAQGLGELRFRVAGSGPGVDERSDEDAEQLGRRLRRQLDLELPELLAPAEAGRDLHLVVVDQRHGAVAGAQRRRAALGFEPGHQPERATPHPSPHDAGRLGRARGRRGRRG